jgi:hypothetical protein
VPLRPAAKTDLARPGKRDRAEQNQQHPRELAIRQRPVAMNSFRWKKRFVLSTTS